MFQVTYKDGTGILHVVKDMVATEYDYVPIWDSSMEWEIRHASELMGDNYDSTNSQHDFYVKVQKGAAEDIKKSIYLSETDVTYEDIGDGNVRGGLTGKRIIGNKTKDNDHKDHYYYAGPFANSRIGNDHHDSRISRDSLTSLITSTLCPSSSRR